MRIHARALERDLLLPALGQRRAADLLLLAEVLEGRDAVGASPSLPGFAAPDVAPRDPLAVIGEAVAEKAARRECA